MKALHKSEEASGAVGGVASREGVGDELTRREEIIRAAVELFWRYGYAGTSIRDIAGTVGVSVSSIYHYFENKEELWLGILEESIKGLPELLKSVWDRELDPVARFRLLIKTHLAASATHQKESKMFFIDQGQLTHKGNSRNKAIQIKVLDIYVQALEEMRAAGYVRTREVKILAFNVLGVINWYLRWYRPDGALPAERVREEISNFVIHGVLGPAE